MCRSLKLFKRWEERLKLQIEGNKLYAEGNKLHVEGNKLCSKGFELHVESDRLWAKAILETYGNIILKWKNWNKKYQSCECHLENDEVYGFNNLEVDDE